MITRQRRRPNSALQERLINNEGGHGRRRGRSPWPTGGMGVPGTTRKASTPACGNIPPALKYEECMAGPARTHIIMPEGQRS